MSIEELIAQLKSEDDKVRGAAWQGAAKAGPKAVKPLAEVMATSGTEVPRAAKRALWKIVRYVGRPGATSEREAVAKEIVGLLGDDRPTAVRREALWMLSELATSTGAVKRVAKLLTDKELREDARMVLQRIPGDDSLRALQNGLEAESSTEFKTAIASSLRFRGVEVPGLPCQKLVGKKTTDVKPVSG